MTSRERNLLIFMGVIAVAGLAYLFLVVLGGEEADEQAAPTPISSPPAAPEQPAIELPEPPTSVTFFGGRDPFVPLVEAEAEQPATGETPAPGQEPAPGETPAPGEEPAPGGEPGGEPAPGGEPGTGGGELPATNGHTGEQQFSSRVFGGRMVTLRELFGRGSADLARVTVDQDKFVLEEGEIFSKNFQLVSLRDQCARFLFGDEAFTLCEGAPPDP